MNGNIKNEWFATKPEEFEIMYEAGINRVKQREVKCNQREIDCNNREKKLNEKDMENDIDDDHNDSCDESDGKIKSKKNKVNKKNQKNQNGNDTVVDHKSTKSNNVTNKRKGNKQTDREQSKSTKMSTVEKHNKNMKSFGNSKKKKQIQESDSKNESIVEKNVLVDKMIVLEKRTESPSDNNNNIMSDNEENYWNSTVKVIHSETYVQFSPGQITISNDSLLDGFTLPSPGTFLFNLCHIICVYISNTDHKDVKKNLKEYYNNYSCGKVNGMVNGDNEDPELNECHIIWEIERDWGAKYYRRSTKILIKIKKCDYKVDEVVNHRKQSGFEGELLVVWNSGERDWSPVSQVHADKCHAMVEDYLSRKSLTNEMMQFGLYIIQQEEIERKLKEKRELKRLQLENEMLQKVTPKTRGRPTKKQPAKRKLETEYGSENKKEKASKYNKKVNSSLPKSRTTRSSKRVFNFPNPVTDDIVPNPVKDNSTDDETKENESTKYGYDISPDSIEIDIENATDIAKEIADKGYEISLDAIDIDIDLEKFKNDKGLQNGNYSFKLIELASGKRYLQGKFYNATI